MPRGIERTVWDRVKEALAGVGLPPIQEEAAKIISGKQGSISDWNKPNRYPSIDNAVAIAKRTNTCVEWIYTGRGPKHPGPPEEPDAQQLWDLWGRLPELTRGKILGIAEENAIPVPKRKVTDQLQRRSG